MRTTLFLFLTLSLFVTACTSDKPEDYFNRAILNTNLLVGFGGDGMQRELASPSIRLNKDGSTSPMKQSEVLDEKIASIKESLAKVRKLSITDETRPMINTSVALHELVLQSAENEYRQLAKLYETNAPAATIDAQASAISDKYYPRMAQLHDSLVAIGKLYAAKHDIPVQWDVRTSPR